MDQAKYASREAPPASFPIKWQWLNDNPREWTDFTARQSALIERAFQCKSRYIEIDEHRVIDLSTNPPVQRRKDDKHRARHVRRMGPPEPPATSPPAPAQVVWEWLADDKSWVAYNTLASLTLEEAWCARVRKVQLDTKYTVNLESMEQSSTAGVRRHIRRNPSLLRGSAPAPEPPAAQLSQLRGSTGSVPPRPQHATSLYYDNSALPQKQAIPTLSPKQQQPPSPPPVESPADLSQPPPYQQALYPRLPSPRSMQMPPAAVPPRVPAAQPLSRFQQPPAQQMPPSVPPQQQPPRRPGFIDATEWFTFLTGVNEAKFKESMSSMLVELPSQLADRGQFLGIKNATSGRIYVAGGFCTPSLYELEEFVKHRKMTFSPPSCMLHIITREDSESVQAVDIGMLQANPKNKDAMFQAASNFNAVEGIDEITPPDSECFTENYVWDRTQGPQASISAGAAAITRVHAAFYSKTLPSQMWRQTCERQVELLHDVRPYFTVRNGYVCQTGTEPPLPSMVDDLLLKCRIGLHTGVQVTFAGFENDELRVAPQSASGPPQTVDQVFCAAMNIAQGTTGEENAKAPDSQVKANFLLRAAYRGTYLAALANGRSRLFLTLIGGGVFGNSISEIYNIILEEHARWTKIRSNTLSEVFIVHWSHSEPDLNAFARNLHARGIAFQWSSYTKNKAQPKSFV